MEQLGRQTLRDLLICERRPNQSIMTAISGKQRITVYVWLVLLASMWAFPPWIHFAREADPRFVQLVEHPSGYYFFADTQQEEKPLHRRFIVFQIDLPRLVVQSVLVSTIMAVAFILFRDKRI